jgi:signal transduction histidine kinase
MDRPVLTTKELKAVSVTISSLAGLLEGRRRDLVRRWEVSVREKLASGDFDRFELVDTLPRFLDELVSSLEMSGRALHALAPMPTGPLRTIAVAHGEQRMRLGFSIDEVVREYGLLHEAILELAEESGYVPRAAEQRVLARAISRATAAAVSEYARRRDDDLQRQSAEHFGFLAHELRNPLTSARVACDLLLRASQGQADRAGGVLSRSLSRLSELIDHSLIAARLRGRMPLRPERVSIAELVSEALAESTTDAEARRITLTAETGETLEIEADRRLVRSVLTNLLRNAIKFSREGGCVVVRARGSERGVEVDVEDSCGGIPGGVLAALFAPYVQAGRDRSGFGLGLSIARQAVEAHGGSISVRSLAGRGCVFSIVLPLAPAPPSE